MVAHLAAGTGELRKLSQLLCVPVEPLSRAKDEVQPGFVPWEMAGGDLLESKTPQGCGVSPTPAARSCGAGQLEQAEWMHEEGGWQPSRWSSDHV